MRAINSKVEQEQLRQAADNKLKTVESEQKQKVAIAEAEASAVRATADGEAYARLKVATAEAESLRSRVPHSLKARMSWNFGASRSSRPRRRNGTDNYRAPSTRLRRFRSRTSNNTLEQFRMTPASPRRRQREVTTGSFNSTGRADEYSDTARR